MERMQGQNTKKLSEKGPVLSSYPAAALCHTKAEVLQQEGLVLGQKVANTMTVETWHCHLPHKATSAKAAYKEGLLERAYARGLGQKGYR